jgi:hypothetical protein
VLHVVARRPAFRVRLDAGAQRVHLIENADSALCCGVFLLTGGKPTEPGFKAKTFRRRLCLQRRRLVVPGTSIVLELFVGDGP